jgi:hypothetical protein
MLDALPGQSGFSGWFRNLVANLAVFPATIVMFLLGMILIGPPRLGPITLPNVGIGPFKLNPLQLSPNSGFSGGGWVPPGFGGAADIAALQGLIGFAIILMTPKVAEMVKSALQIKPAPYGAAIAAPIMTAGSIVATPVTYPTGIIRGGMEKGLETKIAQKAQTFNVTQWWAGLRGKK